MHSSSIAIARWTGCALLGLFLSISARATLLLETEGRIVVEAENYKTVTAGTGTCAGYSWTKITDANASGGQAIRALDGSGSYGSVTAGDTTDGPHADYDIYLAGPTTKTYYVWVHVTADDTHSDSVHVALDGTLLTAGAYGIGTGTGAAYSWKSTYNGSTRVSFAGVAGRHTLSLYMRENGAKVDKIIVTDQIGDTFSEDGPGETDTASGIAASLSTLNSLLTGASPGQTIAMASGTWSNAVITFTADGTSAAPITLRAAIPGQVFLSGQSQITVKGDWLDVDGLYFKDGYTASLATAVKVEGDHDRITNCTLLDYSPSTGKHSWVTLNGAYDRVDHCYFEGKRGSGTLLLVLRDTTTPEDYHQIDHNVFYDVTNDNTADPGETIRVGTSTADPSTDSYTLIQSNYFEACNGDAEIISTKASHCTIDDNTFVDSEGSVSLREGTDGTVSNNVILVTAGDPACGGIRLSDENHVVTNNYVEGIDTGSSLAGGVVLTSSEDDPATSPPYDAAHHWPVRNATVDHNTFYHCNQSFVYGGGHSGSGASKYAYAPVSAAFVENVADTDGADVIIRNLQEVTSHTHSTEKYDGSAIASPALSGSTAGILLASYTLTAVTVNGYTLHLDQIHTNLHGAEDLTPHRMTDTDMGPQTYTP